MNNVADLLTGVLKDGGIEKIGKSVGLEKADAGKAISSALPELLKALQKNTKTKKGADSLKQALEKDHDGSLLGDLSGLLKNPDSAGASAILGHILGGKTDKTIEKITKVSGVSPEQSAGILKALAPLLMGSLGKAKKDGTFDISQLGELAKGLGSKKDMLTMFLDKDGDGEIKDDIFNMIINWIKNKFFNKK